MSTKKFYLVFYLNLIYSSIPKEDRLTVIKKCYWPLFKLMEKGIHVSIQLSGVTLEIIQRLDPDWVEILKEYLKNGKCELVGNGYAQIIAPLIPSEVNHFNQNAGLEIYYKFLNVTPPIATINEMVYSVGIIEHFINNNYKAIMMEWNNPRRFHPEWENDLRYYCQIVTDTNGRDIPLLWVDSIIFQKFQRYVHGSIELNDYISYLENIGEKAGNGFSCLYASDTEIFDYKPRRYKDEASIDSGNSEWKRIEDLFDILLKRDDFKFLLPIDNLAVTHEEHSGNHLQLESPQNPIPVKKQEKYNLNRWALTGRGDLEINTMCYKLFNLLKDQDNTNKDDWKELCYLWSSDFRTHIEEKRWQNYKSRLTSFFNRINYHSTAVSVQPSVNKDQKEITYIDNKKDIIIETDFIKCILNKNRGLSISSCVFKNISEKPLLGTLEHGYYDDITLGADFYSGHTIIEQPVNHKITDLNKTEASIDYDNDTNLNVSTSVIIEGITFKKTYSFGINRNEIGITNQISLPKRDYAIIHPVNITFIPTSFNCDSLFFGTNNGSKNIEIFPIGNCQINHSENLSPLISAKYGLGATEGVVVVGDDRHSIQLVHDNAVSALIPSIVFLKFPNNQFFLRLQYSAQEFDETFRKSNDAYHIHIQFKICF